MITIAIGDFYPASYPDERIAYPWVKELRNDDDLIAPPNYTNDVERSNVLSCSWWIWTEFIEAAGIAPMFNSGSRTWKGRKTLFSAKAVEIDRCHLEEVRATLKAMHGGSEHEAWLRWLEYRMSYSLDYHKRPTIAHR